MEIVINKKYGGFGLSYLATLKYAELKGFKLYPWFDEITKRVYGEDVKFDDPRVPLIHYSKHPAERGNKYYFSERDIERDDPDLITVVKEMGEEANARFAKLEIVNVPDGTTWEIEEYDGMEWVAEKHKTWG